MTDFSTFMVTRLQQSTINAHYRYLLIDTSAVESAATSLPLLKCLPSLDVLAESEVDWKETASPVLIQLPEQAITDAQCNQWAFFFEQWRWANAFIYIETHHPFKTVSLALAKRLYVQLSDAQEMLLRYFDTRIFTSLLNVLTPDQKKSFLGVADAWHYPNRDGVCVSLVINDNNALPRKRDTFQSAFELSAQQEFKMLEASETDTMVDLLLSHQETALNTMNPFQQYTTIDALLRAAKTYAIKDIHDQSVFCLLGLGLGTDFYAQDPWASGLINVKNQSVSLRQLLSTLESST